MDTLDEPVTTTLVRAARAKAMIGADLPQGRDLLSIYNKLVQVLYPRRSGSGREVLKCVLCTCFGLQYANDGLGTGIFGVHSSYV